MRCSISNCVTCHNQKLLTAGLALDKADVTNVPAGAQVWEKVVRKLGTSSMPPLGMPRPDKPAYDAFASWLENELDRAAAAKPNPGRVGVRRLNQFEYTNAVRDLLALEVDGRALLPSDESSDGFDNIAEALSVSPLLLERYMIAAHKIGVLALPDANMPPAVATYRIPALLVQDDRMSDDLPIGSRGGRRYAITSRSTASTWSRSASCGHSTPPLSAASTFGNSSTSGWMACDSSCSRSAASVRKGRKNRSAL